MKMKRYSCILWNGGTGIGTSGSGSFLWSTMTEVQVKQRRKRGTMDLGVRGIPRARKVGE